MFFHCGCVCACATAHGWMSDDNPWGDSVLTFHHVGAGNEILSQTKLKDWSHLLSNDMYPAAGNPMRSVGLGGHNAQVADARASLRKENTTKREKGVCLTCCQVSSGRVGGSLLCFPEPGSASLAYAPRWPAAASPKTPVAGRELGPAQRRSGLAPRHARCRLGNVGSSEERGCLVSCLSPPPANRKYVPALPGSQAVYRLIIDISSGTCKFSRTLCGNGRHQKHVITRPTR